VPYSETMGDLFKISGGNKTESSTSEE
jgi:hypothetical protein